MPRKTAELLENGGTGHGTIPEIGIDRGDETNRDNEAAARSGGTRATTDETERETGGGRDEMILEKEEEEGGATLYARNATGVTRPPGADAADREDAEGREDGGTVRSRG